MVNSAAGSTSSRDLEKGGSDGGAQGGLSNANEGQVKEEEKTPPGKETAQEGGDPLTNQNETGGEEQTESAKKSGSRPWLSRQMHDGLLLSCILAMLAWPFIFWGVIRANGGAQADNRTAGLISDHPHVTSFFVTFVANLITVILNILFSLAVIRLAQEWLGMKRKQNRRVTVFHVNLLTGARHQSWPWSRSELKKVFVGNKWLPAILLGACVSAFTFIPGSASSLLTPVQFNKTANLLGNELDFSSTAPDCLSWFAANDLSNNCDWQFFRNVSYTSCLGENQMVDVLESGRGNILSLLSNNSEALTLSQLGAENGIRFLGPIGGILPMGPDGVPAFDTTYPTSPFSDPYKVAGMLAYNYTLEHQGLVSNISCIYDTQSPVRSYPVPDGTRLAFQYNGSCSDVGQADTLGAGVQTFVSVNANNSLAYWACQSPPVDNQIPTYYVYLRGRTGSYNSTFANITCSLSPVSPAVYPVTYHSESSIFSLSPQVGVSTTILPRMIQHALIGMGAIVQQAQNWQANLVAESIITFAVKSFNIKQPYQKLDEYLRLTESMLQGIVEYEATYIRLVYSTKANPPSSCLRNFNGNTTFTVWGWSSEVDQIGLIMPMIVITLVALIMIVLAIAVATSDEEYDAGDLLASRPLLQAAIRAKEADSVEPNQDDEVLEWGRAPAISEAGAKATDGLDWFGCLKDSLGDDN